MSFLDTKFQHDFEMNLKFLNLLKILWPGDGKTVLLSIKIVRYL